MDYLARHFLLFSLVSTAFAAAPVIDEPPANGVPKTLPVGKTLTFPITATDADGDPLTFKVTSNNPRLLVRVKTGNPVLRLTVTYGTPQPGEMVFQLFREWTPITNGFIAGFAQSGFYDNVKFHRVVDNFVLQGGDPLGTGQGGPGMTGGNPATAFKFENEFLPALMFSGRGQLAMANSGYSGDYSATNGSQFFVTLEQLHVPTAAHGVNLDFKHTVFGQMLSGWAVMDAISDLPVDGSSRPTPDVVITSAVVEPDNHDAVLVLSATGLVNNATVTVTATDTQGLTATKLITFSAVADGANSPPVVLDVSPLTAPKETQLNFGLRSFDLEADYLFLNHGLISGGANAASSSQGGVAAVRGNPGFEGGVRMGFEISQFNITTGQAETPVVQSFGTIGIGDRTLRSVPVTVTGAPAGVFTGLVARFVDLDIAGSAANFTAQINWGDGTPVQAGTFAHDATVPGSSAYGVTGTHTYARAGIYTIVVTATGNKGAVGIARNPAVISAGPIVAVGQQIEVKGPTAANRVLATFTDSGTPARPADYTATVDWGDGVTAKGVIAKSATGFVVRGTHVYKDAEPYAVSVRIHKTGAAPTADAYAWSTANVGGFVVPPHLPPFPMAHLVGAWNSGPTKTVTGTAIGPVLTLATIKEVLSGAFVVLNSGNKISPPGSLRFWLSSNPTLDGSDTALLVNGLPQINVSPFGAGLGGTGQFTISLPVGETGFGKYLLGQIIYSDPIIDASRVDKVVVSGPIRATELAYDFTPNQLGRATTGQWLTDENGKGVTFRVALDKQPTADVIVPLESSLVGEGTVAPASLTFTSANWNTAQVVTVTGVNDSVRDGNREYIITLKTPTSTDPNYTGLPAITIPFANLDND